MELLNISQIKNLSTDDFNTYVHSLEDNIPSNYPWETSSIRNILNNIYTLPRDVILGDTVAEYIEAYMIENINNIDITVLNCQYLFSDNLKVVKWVYPAHDNSTFYAVLEEDKLNRIIDTLRNFREFSILPDNFRTRAELEASIQMLDDRDIIFGYFVTLGVLTQEEMNTIIPIPSDTLNIDDTTARFSSALWFEEIQNKTILLAGLGGIGSYVAFLLSRMHPYGIFMYDDDVVETVNLAGQLYGDSDIGRYKVDAMAYKMSEFSNYSSCYSIREKYSTDSQSADIMICGFDNMEARNIFFNNWIKHVESKPEEEQKSCFFIDGRLAAEEFQVFSIRGDDTFNTVKYAKEYLFSDAEADETQCSYKQTTYMANMIGSVIVNLFTNFVANSIEDNIRDLPFLTTYDGSTMTFKTQL